MKLFRQVIKNHSLDLIEFYGIILIMIVPFMLWLLPRWTIDERMLYLCVVQISIFMGLFTRFTRDLTLFNSNVQYCLAPIRQGEKILAPLVFFVVNYLIADALLLFFINLTHTFSLGPIIIGFAQVFLLGCYILIMITLGMLISFTVLPKPQIKIPAIAKNPQQIIFYAGGLLDAVIIILTLFFSQAISRILYTPFFTVTIKAGDYISAGTQTLSINTLPYLVLGAVYVLLIFFLKDKKVYLD